MASHTSRREFLKNTAVAAGGVMAASWLPESQSVLAAKGDEKVKCVLIGCGGRGETAHIPTVAGQHLVALVDADEKRLDVAKAAAKKKNPDIGNIQTFTDYRTMFDKIGKDIEAVFIATPNHQHALPTMIAMQLGKGVYTEKPLCHTIGEARELAAMAAKTKVTTQMGNQGHCEEGYRRLCEYIWAGAIGEITETHSWTDRSNGGSGPRPEKKDPPASMHWDNWIGPAPYRDFHVDLNPHEWHGWYDFGNGSLGNMACHVMDGVYWALKLEHPTQIEVEQVAGGTDERLPTGTRIRWDFPARGDLPAVKVYWYDGKFSIDGGKATQNFPPLLQTLKKENPDIKFDSNGTLYVGSKGILYTGTYGGGMTLVPKAKMEDYKGPAKSLPRPGSVSGDFLRAVREGKNDTANAFDYSSKLTEFILLGNIAQRAGVGKPVQWDGPNMKVTNQTDLNQFLKYDYRKGWSV